MPAKKKTAKAPVRDQTDIARRIWLAGVGAYGRAFQTAQGQLDKLAVSAQEAFDQLVARGEAVEDVVRASIAKNETAQKVAGAVEKIDDFRTARRAALQARVDNVRKAVDATIAPFNPLALSKQIAALTARVEKLEAELAKAKAKRPAPRRA